MMVCNLGLLPIPTSVKIGLGKMGKRRFDQKNWRMLGGEYGLKIRKSINSSLGSESPDYGKPDTLPTCEINWTELLTQLWGESRESGFDGGKMAGDDGRWCKMKPEIVDKI